MSHIFISYSHRDKEYAHVLAEHLQSKGFRVWIDDRIDYGSQWPGEIQKQLDSCDAFILIMSPRSFASEWVQSELQRAKRKAKPVFPLLLEGDESWLSVESTQYYDVRNRSLPNDEFYADIKQAVSARTPSQPQGSATKAESIESSRPRGRKTVGWFAVGGLAAICTCLLTGVLWFQREADKGLFPSIPTGTDIITAQSNTPSPAALTSTVISAVPTVATTIVLPVQLPDGSEVRMIDVATGGEYQYTVLSAQRESPLQDKYLLHLRIRAWTNGSLGFWSDSFRLVAGDLSLAPVNRLSLVVRQNETIDGDIEFEIDASLKEAILRITVGYSLDPWATKELRLVFP
jgi:hypothetical protein